MRVLVACEYSGTVRDAFSARGHDATSCDLLPTETDGKHYQGDVFDIIRDGWDLMIAHPPCTYLSRAGARWMYPTAGVVDPTRHEKAKRARGFFMSLLNAPIGRIAVENPLPLKIAMLPKPSQIIQPYEYGHAFSKKTLLWLKNLPHLKPTKVLNNYVPFLPSNTGGKKRGQTYRFSSISQKDSSKTFQGIADAMAAQWDGS